VLSLWSLVFDFVTPVCSPYRPTDNTEIKREIHTGVTKSKTSDHRDQQTTLKLRENYIQELQSQKQVTIVFDFVTPVCISLLISLLSVGLYGHLFLTL
jgi:hypothetical protein